MDGCEKRELARLLCAMHYHRALKYGSPGEVEPRRAANSDGPCAVEECGNAVVAHGFCPKHLRRWKLYGDPLGSAERTEPKTIEELRREAYEGAPGGQDTPSGYRYRTLRRGERYGEHRLVVEYMIGRALVEGETVHHRNGQRADNRPENLELWSSSQPPGQRVADKVAWAREILALYDGIPEAVL